MTSMIFGQPKFLHTGPGMNAMFFGKYILIIQSGAYPHLSLEHNGRMLVLRRDSLSVVAVLDGIGSARQLAVQDRYAYITSREDGLFIVDLSSPADPRIVNHYKTVEYATGIAVSGNLAVVSMRQYGLEFIDVSNPEAPQFISLARTGEAQSLCLDGHYAYAGVWGTRELVIVDFLNISDPQVISRTELDGRGDGVAVRNGLCYAATGHHSRTLGENMGNGLEIFDVSDPSCPKRLSIIKFPPYYGLTFDMWQVRLEGNIAMVSNTRNGLFALDVSNPLKPEILDRMTLDGDPISGFDYSDGLAVLTGGEQDCCLLSVQLPWKHPIRQPLKFDTLFGPDLHWRCALDGHHVQYVVSDRERLFIACPGEGILVLDKKTLAIRQMISSEGFVDALVWAPPYLYAAEGLCGIRTYQEKNGVFQYVSEFTYCGRALCDLQLSGDKKSLLVQCASVGVLLLSLDDPACPCLTDSLLDFVGLFYGRHFPSHGYGKRMYLAVNRDGCFCLTNTEGYLNAEPFLLDRRIGLGPESGLEIAGDRLLLVQKGRCLSLPLIPGKGSLQIQEDARLRGKPRMFGDLLILTERAKGVIILADASEPEDLKVFCEVRTTASPDLAYMDDEHIWIPGGRFGLLIGNLPRRN